MWDCWFQRKKAKPAQCWVSSRAVLQDFRSKTGLFADHLFIQTQGKTVKQRLCLLRFVLVKQTG